MPDPSPRTLTFLFTDIEGSTRRWETDRAAMSAALARHDVLLRAAIEGQGGTVFKTVGDAFCAVFADPVAALGAAVAAQRALAEEDWGRQGEGFQAMQVRMALHSGLAEEREGDYFGPTLNRAARLLAAGHGGQVLLSAVTEGLLSGHLPEGVTLRDLGEHRLKDLSRAERVWQVAAEGLDSEHPPIRSLERVRHNLPVLPTLLVGREEELARLRAMLERSRLVTLLGPGGMGKTRLALQAAADSVEGQPDGAWFVDLAPVTTAGGVAPAAATALGVAEEAGRELTDSLLDYLRGRRLLLVLDNCEQVIEAAARLAEDVGRAAPGVTLLATSREALRVPGEMTLSLELLAVPDEQKLAEQADPATALQDYDGTKLFIERATAVRSDFRVTRANAAAIAAICRQLDGLPLALELAAARMRHMAPEHVLVQLRDRFRLLTTGARTALPRQQTLAAAIDWSHALLDEEEQRVFRRLAIFRGGWTMEAAEAVCADEAIEGWQVMELVTHFVDKSLVLARDAVDGGTRYQMLDSIRAYAAEKLAASGERAKVAGRHAEWLHDLTDEAERYRPTAESGHWLTRLATEMDNTWAALERALDGTVPIAPVASMAANLWWLWTAHGGRSLATAQLIDLRQRFGGQLDPSLSARLSYALAFIVSDPIALPLLHEALAGAEAVGDRRLAAWCWHDLAQRLLFMGNAEEAWEAGQRELAIKLELGTAWDIGIAHLGLGFIAGFRDDQVQALEHTRRAVMLMRATGNRGELVWALSNLSELEASQGHLIETTHLVDELLTLARELGDPNLMAMGEAEAVMVCCLSGTPNVAVGNLAEALRLWTALDNRSNLAGVGLLFGAWAAALAGADWTATVVYHAHLRLRDRPVPFHPSIVNAAERAAAEAAQRLDVRWQVAAEAAAGKLAIEDAYRLALASLNGLEDIPPHA